GTWQGWKDRTQATYLGGNCYSYTISESGTISGWQAQLWTEVSGGTQIAQIMWQGNNNNNVAFKKSGSSMNICADCCQGTTPTVPSVTLTAPASVFIGSDITFSAEALNFTDAVITYYVKLPNAADYQAAAITSPYTPATTGNYAIKAVAVESSDAGITAFAEKTVTVNPVPPGAITVRWKKGDDLTWQQMGIYEWSTGGGALCGTWPGIQVTADGDGWYSYIFTETPENIIFNNFISTSEAGGLQVNGPVSPASSICLELHSYYYCEADCQTGVAPCSEYGTFEVKWVNLNAWSDMSIYAWFGTDGITQIFGPWAGKIVTPDINGIYSQTFVKVEPVNIIFTSTIGGEQTVNLEGIFNDVCYNISTATQTLNDKELNIIESTDCSTLGEGAGIDNNFENYELLKTEYFTLHGVKINEPQKDNIYIVRKIYSNRVVCEKFIAK
ncbi:MAG: starch-binding protein, partial [Prevotellaceae bacterium]|nr:starch-binding protein [Prevotellaceae bacterium]